MHHLQCRFLKFSGGGPPHPPSEVRSLRSVAPHLSIKNCLWLGMYVYLRPPFLTFLDPPLRSTAENCQHREPSRWPGGTAATLNMFKTSAVPPLVGPIRSGVAEAPPLPPRHRRGTVQGPQYHLHHRSASAAQPPCNREKKVDWRPYGDPVAFLLRLWRCNHGATNSLALLCCRQYRSHAANDRRGTAIKRQL